LSSFVYKTIAIYSLKIARFAKIIVIARITKIAIIVRIAKIIIIVKTSIIAKKYLNQEYKDNF